MINNRPYQSINRHGGWLRRAWDAGYIHATVGMVVVAALCLTLWILAGIYQPEPPRINDRAPALEKLERRN